MFKKTIMSFALALLVTSATSVSANEMMMDSSINANLGVGSMGSEVIKLQTILESKGYLMVPAGVKKGYFGQLTKMAVMKFQKDNGVSGTGYFGAMSRAKIKGIMSMNSMNNEQGVMVGGAMMLPSRDIVDNAVLANNVTTVVAAVKAAGLVDTLKSAGPFTVFAPTNDAFDKLPAGTVETLIKPENKGTLTGILTYHVIAGRYTQADISNGLKLKTVNGKELTFSKDAQGQIMINANSKVLINDIISKNGVTFAIDTVLLP